MSDLLLPLLPSPTTSAAVRLSEQTQTDSALMRASLPLLELNEMG